MKKFYTPARVFALALLVAGLAPQNSSAQSTPPTLSVSPGDLSFGVPTGTSPAVSAPDTVTVTLSGSGSVSFTNVTVAATGTPDYSADFIVDGNSCTGMIAAPNTCQVTLHFIAKIAPLGTMETATLTIAYSAGTLTVPLNGAYGAIKLFSPLNINLSLFSYVTWTQSPPTGGQTLQSTTVNLSCPAGATAFLSSTPDGSGNVFQDNTIQVANTYGTTPTSVTTSNVCYGGDTNFQGFTGFPTGSTNCFRSSYESAVVAYLAPAGIGQNPDITGYPLGTGGPGSFVAQYGVAPFSVASLLSTGTQSLTVQMQDAGGDLGSATLHLVTSCSLAGVTPGGSITGNPINSNNPASLTQTSSFDTGGGQNISFTNSVANAVQSDSVTIPSGTIPVVTDIGIPQQLFYQLVANTSAAPAVCVRITGEVDPFNPTNYLCKAFLLQCQAPGGSTVSGSNCVPTPSTLRNILESTQYSSPDEPADTNTNFLSSSCTFYLNNNGTCAPSMAQTLIGPGLLMGGDGWTCAPSANLTTCTPVAISGTVNSTTSSSTVYSQANCALSGGLTNNLCPIDVLTQFLGAADARGGGTTPITNSIFVPVVNMPKPFTQTTIAGQNSNGWVSTSSLNAKFVANQATYPSTGNIPLPNGFLPAAPYSVTYGIAPLSTPLPDTTFPVATDALQYADNSTVYHNTDPIQLPTSIANCTSGSPLPSFTANDSFAPTQGNGIYNLHYFTTDCALTEGLVFNPTPSQLTNPAANWASFQVTSVGWDNVPPSLACTVSPPASNGTNGWYTTANVSASCSATDPVPGSGFGIGTAASSVTTVTGTNPAVLQGSSTTSIGPVSTVVGLNPAAAAIPAQVIQDLAGNSSNTQGPYATPIDTTPPSIGVSYPNGQSFTVGQSPASITYTCADTGSGIATCPASPAPPAAPVPPACLAAPAAGPLTFSSSYPINTSTPGTYTFSVNSTDCAGNISASVRVSYKVFYPSADLVLLAGSLPGASVKIGAKITYGFIASNLGPSTGYGVTITDALPSGLSFVGASLTNGITSETCTYVSGAVTCNIGNLPVVPHTGSIYIGQITAKVTAAASSTVTNTIQINGLNPDPNTKNNSVSVSIKVTRS
jgi:uncharacterized repeat protein (TIGR01451 family)